jgi:two-component system KDP operon response regulator KdpE
MISMNDAGEKRIVLVVDDERKVLRFMEIDLKLRGFEVITTTSGEGALELIKSAKPDIMLLDIIMPKMDGFEVLRQLRAFSQMPVIAFSASIANYGEAMQLGANAFISKPFKINDIVDRINTFLSQKT